MHTWINQHHKTYPQAVQKLTLVDRCQHFTALRHIIELLVSERFSAHDIELWCVENAERIPRLQTIVRDSKSSKYHTDLTDRIQRVCALLGIK